jgi:hypothetical protein
MSSGQHLDLMCFLAKLASARVSKDRACQIALLSYSVPLSRSREDFLLPRSWKVQIRLNVLAALALETCCQLLVRESTKQHTTSLSSRKSLGMTVKSSVGQGRRTFVEPALGERSPTGFIP